MKNKELKISSTSADSQSNFSTIELEKLDKALTGFNKGKLTLIASESTESKTRLALDIVNYANKHSNLFFSLGLTNNNVFRDQQLRSADRFKIIEDQTMNLNQIISICRDEKIKKTLDIVVIDDISFITISDPTQAEKIAMDLKAMAKALECHVILNVLLPKSSHRSKSVPNELRKIGQLEADADTILFHHKCDDLVTSEVLILKNRLGDITSIPWNQYK